MRADAKSAAQSAHGTARNVATGKGMSLFARFGYAMKGVVYLIIGFLALQLAFGQGGKATDQRGALHAIYDQPLGKILLVIVAIGLIAYALWSFIQAIFDTEAKGSDAKGIIGRIGYAVVGVSYGLLAFGALQLVLGSGNSSTNTSTTTSTQDWTASFLKQSYGVPLVILLGLIVIGVALYLIYKKAYKADFKRRLYLTGASARLSKWAVALGRLGYGALGVVFTIIGIFLLVAAFQHNASKAKGLDAALQELLHLPFGPIILAIIALGLFAYGVYSFVEARYRRVGRAM